MGRFASSSGNGPEGGRSNGLVRNRIVVGDLVNLIGASEHAVVAGK